MDCTCRRICHHPGCDAPIGDGPQDRHGCEVCDPQPREWGFVALAIFAPLLISLWLCWDVQRVSYVWDSLDRWSYPRVKTQERAPVGFWSGDDTMFAGSPAKIGVTRVSQKRVKRRSVRER